MSLRDTWKETGTGLGHAFKDLGKAIVKSASTAAKKADDWANGDEKPQETKAEEVKAEEVKAEETKDEEEVKAEEEKE